MVCVCVCDTHWCERRSRSTGKGTPTHLGEEAVYKVASKVEGFSLESELLADFHEPVKQDGAHVGGNEGLSLQHVGVGAVELLGTMHGIKDAIHDIEQLRVCNMVHARQAVGFHRQWSIP